MLAAVLGVPLDLDINDLLVNVILDVLGKSSFEIFGQVLLVWGGGVLLVTRAQCGLEFLRVLRSFLRTCVGRFGGICLDRSHDCQWGADHDVFGVRKAL